MLYFQILREYGYEEEPGSRNEGEYRCLAKATQVRPNVHLSAAIVSVDADRQLSDEESD